MSCDCMCSAPPTHAAEIDRIAALLTESRYSSVSFARALTDLLSLKKRHFAQVDTSEWMGRIHEMRTRMNEALASADRERASHAETKRALLASQRRTTAEMRELANTDALYVALKEFLA